MKKREFDAIAKLLRSREPARTSAELVLVKGKAIKDAVAAILRIFASVPTLITP